MQSKELLSKKLCVIGLGYVGLPLALEFGKKFHTIGFDIDESKILDFKKGFDPMKEISQFEFLESKKITFTSDPEFLKGNDIYIVTVPTPVDSNKKPNLNPLISASKIIGKYLQKNSIVIYESTVFPGATEEICVPFLEKESGLIYNKDFYCGYSPERINPGDKKHTISSIVKVTSGSNESTAQIVDQLYRSIISAGTHLASSIKVAEAAKVIENTQRDLNIALMNELSIIFSKINIDTNEVLDAANTKWNFIKFSPGLVGGHCIGVDPYYLTHKAQELNYHPEVILSGRKINDNMPNHIANIIIKTISPFKNKSVLVLGITFKENCSDIRNTKVTDLIYSLKDYKISVDVVDPKVSQESVKELYNISCMNNIQDKKDYSAVILAVPHEEFISKSSKDLKNLSSNSKVKFFDLKGVYPKNESDFRL